MGIANIRSQERDVMSQETDIMSQEKNKILDLNPGNNESLGLKAKALFMLGRLEEALVFYHRALRGAGPTGEAGRRELLDDVRRCEDAVLATLLIWKPTLN